MRGRKKEGEELREPLERTYLTETRTGAWRCSERKERNEKDENRCRRMGDKFERTEERRKKRREL